MPAFHDLPQSFRREQRELEQAGLDQWEQLRDLSDIQLSRLCRSGQASARNLKRLRAIAAMVCDLDLAPQDAALLMHAGIASRGALAGATPNDSYNRPVAWNAASAPVARPWWTCPPPDAGLHGPGNR